MPSLTDVERLKAAGNFRASLEGIEGESEILTRTLETIQNVLGFDLAQIYLQDEDGRFSRHVRLGLGAAETPRGVSRCAKVMKRSLGKHLRCVSRSWLRVSRGVNAANI